MRVMVTRFAGASRRVSGIFGHAGQNFWTKVSAYPFGYCYTAKNQASFRSFMAGIWEDFSYI